MLQAEIHDAKMEIQHFEQQYKQVYEAVQKFSPLLSEKFAMDPQRLVSVKQVHKRYENIAGVEVPYYEGIDFEEISYPLYDTPAWIDAAISSLKDLAEAKAEVVVAEEKKNALEKELREVSIRVNLFEKILIPRSLNNIKKIKVFLSDLELAAVSRAKMAKNKLEEKKIAEREA